MISLDVAGGMGTYPSHPWTEAQQKLRGCDFKLAQLLRR